MRWTGGRKVFTNDFAKCHEKHNAEADGEEKHNFVVFLLQTVCQDGSKENYNIDDQHANEAIAVNTAELRLWEKEKPDEGICAEEDGYIQGEE